MIIRIIPLNDTFYNKYDSRKKSMAPFWEKYGIFLIGCIIVCKTGTYDLTCFAFINGNKIQYHRNI